MRKLIAFFKMLYRLPRDFFWGTMWGLALVLNGWYLVRMLVGDQSFLIRMSNYFMPWMLFALSLPLFMALIGRRFRVALALAIPFGLMLSHVGPQLVPQPDFARAQQPTLKVMSYNVLYIDRDANDILAVIKQEQPDLLLLQEMIPPLQEQLEQGLADLYGGAPVYISYEPHIAQTIVSRYPLTALGGFQELGRTQKVIAHMPQGDVQVWNTHPPVAVGQNGWEAQRAHLTGLAAQLSLVKQDQPLILGGDFNTTPQSDHYRLFAKHLRDTHVEAGWGLGFSFPANGMRTRNRLIDLQWWVLESQRVRQAYKAVGITPRAYLLSYKTLPIPPGPVVKIDHIFVNEPFTVLNAYTVEASGGSDHLPVVAVMVIEAQ